MRETRKTMTSRLNQRAKSALAILAVLLLLLLIITLWILHYNGLFNKPNENRNTAVNSLVHSSIVTPASGSPYAVPRIYLKNTGKYVSKEQQQFKETIGKIFIPPENFETSGKDTEIVKPVKTSPLPLHEQDLIYEQSKYGDRKDLPEQGYHSGQFRYKNAKIWDPHPEYDIHAFGKTIHLKLSQDSSFVASDIKFSKMWKSKLVNVTPEYKTENCFYTGSVEGDEFSSVAVSLCHGMTGYIRTNDEIYFIEPTEMYQKHQAAKTILHAIHRHKYNKKDNPDDNLVELEPHYNCDTTDHPKSLPKNDNTRLKRSLRHHPTHRYRPPPSSSSAPQSSYVNNNNNRRSKTSTTYFDQRKLLSMRHINDYLDDQYEYLNDYYQYTGGGGGSGGINGVNTGGNNIINNYDDKFIYYNTNSNNNNNNNNEKDWNLYNKAAYTTVNSNNNDNSNNNNNNNEHRWKRNKIVDSYIVEVLIIMDKTMKTKKFIKGDLHHYILTLMSHVALLFRNDSLGNSIKISVVGIIDLDEHDILPNTHNLTSAVMLKNFCEWQQSSSHVKNHMRGRSYDVALLFTRARICRDEKYCDVLGVANEASMCRKDSCGVIKETGLGTSFTIAHEIGHVLGMPHDGTKSCERFHKDKQILGTMAQAMGQNSNPWLWSPCAKHYLTNFIDSIHSQCLLNGAAKDMILDDEEDGGIQLPGENITPDEQCKLINPELTHCRTSNIIHCDSLYCEHYAGCQQYHHLVADGTLCNVTSHFKGVCVQGECIDSRHIKRIDGGWGEYGPWGECSMTCGGGIRKRRRDCNNPRPHFGKYCAGPAVEYSSCNTHDCPKNPSHPFADAREEQCNKFNGDNRNIISVPTNVIWVPKYGLRTCKLYCRVENRSDYYPLATKVKDGTKCDLGDYGICVNGICRKGACDNKLDSDVTLDICGKCGGDNSTCYEISNVITDFYKDVEGYVDILTIPKGSMNINIWKKKLNVYDGRYFYLAVKNESGGYIFNGNYSLQPDPISQKYGGLKLKYSGTNSEIESIVSDKLIPLKRDLIIQVLKSGESTVPVHYSYMVFKEIHRKYRWIYSNWTECDSYCEGRKYRHPVCVESIYHQEVSPEYCSNEIKPESYIQQCNTRCKFRWVKDERNGECSVTCGRGERHVYYHCVLIDYNEKKIVSDTHCSKVHKPPSVEECENQCDIFKWKSGNWSTCSVTCGGGQQSRTVVCIDIYDRQVNTNFCDKYTMPDQIRTCRSECPKWILTNDWEPCSATCGQGIQVRKHACYKEPDLLPDYYCDPQPKAIITQTCYSNSLCFGNWTVSSWGECDRNCYRNRQVRCIGNNYQTLNNNQCDERNKPTHAEACAKEECHFAKPRIRPQYPHKFRKCRWRDTGCPKTCAEIGTRPFTCINDVTKRRCREHFCKKEKPFKNCPSLPNCAKKYYWRPEKWGKCPDISVRPAFQRRKVFCYDENHKRVRNRFCKQENLRKPKNKQRCIYRRCKDIQLRLNKRDDGEYPLLIRGRHINIYCHGMRTNYPKEYLTVNANYNFARFDDQRAENPNLECNQVQRTYPLESDFGHTTFERVRLNVTSLKIDIDDFTFATHSGRPMKFGTAGDCYSRQPCPKGTFMIYLHDTGFRVSSKTRWIPYEPNSTVDVDTTNPKNIIGKCGGFCGSCEPDKLHGLLLELT